MADMIEKIRTETGIYTCKHSGRHISVVAFFSTSPEPSPDICTIDEIERERAVRLAAN